MRSDVYIMTGVNLSVKSRIVYINYSLFMFIEAMCKGETKSRSRRCAKGSAPSARSSSLWACLIGYELGPKESRYVKFDRKGCTYDVVKKLKFERTNDREYSRTTT